MCRQRILNLSLGVEKVELYMDALRREVHATEQDIAFRESEKGSPEGIQICRDRLELAEGQLEHLQQAYDKMTESLPPEYPTECPF